MKKVFIGLLFISVGFNAWQTFHAKQIEDLLTESTAKNGRLYSSAMNGLREIKKENENALALYLSKSEIANASLAKTEAIAMDIAKENESLREKNSLLFEYYQATESAKSKERQIQIDARVTPGRITPPRIRPSIDPVPVKQWIEAVKFTGNGAQNTEAFVITGEQWRIRWSARSLAKDNQLLFSVTSKGTSEDMLANTLVTGSETSYGGGAGTYRLEINAVQASWDIIVEQTFSR